MQTLRVMIPPKKLEAVQMMFAGEDHQALQSLMDNGSMTPEDPIKVLDAIKNNKRGKTLLVLL